MSSPIGQARRRSQFEEGASRSYGASTRDTSSAIPMANSRVGDKLGSIMPHLNNLTDLQ